MCDTNFPLDTFIENQIKMSKITKDNVDLLDVGCGPVSSVGYKSKDVTISLTGADPLVDQYDVYCRHMACRGLS